MSIMQEQVSLAGLQALPGYQFVDYQLILAPPDHLREKVRKVRAQLQEHFQLKGYGQPPIGIPLVRFSQRLLLEEKIRKAFERTCMAIRPFPVHLKDYQAYPSHSIVIPVLQHHRLKELGESIKPLQSLLRADKEHAPFFYDQPFVSVARGLTPFQFEEAWKQYAQRHFTGQFMADACLLLKKRKGERYWQIAQRFEFLDLPMAVKQGELFAMA